MHKHQNINEVAWQVNYGLTTSLGMVVVVLNGSSD